MNYILKYKDMLIGDITYEEKDFPNFFGKFEKNEKLMCSKVNNFIELSIKESSLVEMEHEKDISSDLEALEKEIEQYLEFIESDEWKLIDENKKEYKILVPSFQINNEILFRFQI